MGIEDLDQLGEVGQRAGQSIDLVKDNQIEPTGGDIGQETLHRRSAESAAREAAIVVEGGQSRPALVPLAGNIGEAGFALGVEGIEVLLETVLGGFAGVDGAANGP